MVKLRWEDLDPASDDWCYRLAEIAMEAKMTDILALKLESADSVREAVGKYRSELASAVSQPGFAGLPHKDAVLGCLLACDRLLSALPAALDEPSEYLDFAREGA